MATRPRTRCLSRSDVCPRCGYAVTVIGDRDALARRSAVVWSAVLTALRDGPGLLRLA